jgi:hypothetical protein
MAHLRALAVTCVTSNTAPDLTEMFYVATRRARACNVRRPTIKA